MNESTKRSLEFLRKSIDEKLRYHLHFANTPENRARIRTVLQAALNQHAEEQGLEPLDIDVSMSVDDPNRVVITPANARTQQFLMEAGFTQVVEHDPQIDRIVNALRKESER